MTRRKNTGRKFTPIHDVFKLSSAVRVSAVIITALLQIPAFFSSCERSVAVPEATIGSQIYIQWTKNTTPEAIDVFFFDTHGAQELDSYQQIRWPEGSSHAYGISGAGEKRMVAFTGTPGVTDPWLDIRNYGSICKKTYRLEEEDLYAPHLVAETLLPDAASRTLNLNLQPMLSQIRMESVSCDFSGRPYRDTPFMCEKIYLSYLVTEYRPLGAGGGRPVSWINAGPLDSIATLALPRPEMALRKGPGPIGRERIYPNVLLHGYANPAGDDGIPRTRLVLEGTLNGFHCYYPIEIPDLQPNQAYSFNLTIRRMGSPDPDIPVSSDAVSVETAIVPWQIRDPYTVTF